MVEDSIAETSVNEVVEDIIIIKDEISVKNSSGNTIYEITMDDAVIIKTDNSVYTISREWSLDVFCQQEFLTIILGIFRL